MKIFGAGMFTKDILLVITDCGLLFLDNEDFEMFDFDPYYVIDFYDNDEVLQLMIKIKQYYDNLAIEMIEKGEIKYENFS